MPLTVDRLRSAIKVLYTRRAEESDLWYPYCFASHAALGAIDRTRSMGYSEAELQGVPEESIMGLGCGNPFSLIALAAGDTVLDLGSGGGMDAFLASRKVGPQGRVIGIDITEEMVRKARITAAHYGFRNVEFRQGEMEHLPLESGSVDAVMSNFAISLSPDKPAVFREVFRMLRPGGRLAICEPARKGDGRLPMDEESEAGLWYAAGALEGRAYADLLAASGFEAVEIVWEREFAMDECGEAIRAVSIGVRARKPAGAIHESPLPSPFP